jgi:large subunit ribosomal protein L23
LLRKYWLQKKSTVARDKSNKYFFEVNRNANKVEISEAVEKLFKVKVADVRVMHVLGKKKRTGRTMGQKSSWKKAIVTLAAGSRIEIAEGV